MNSPTQTVAQAAELERECAAFLFDEADALDRWELHRWLDMLSRDIDYRVPVRSNRLGGSNAGFSTRSFFLREDLGSLQLRIRRLDSEAAWSENPRTRTRRMVANVRVRETDGDTVTVSSNLMVLCYRGESPDPVILSCERRDVLVREASILKLKSRLALLDTTVLGMDALSIFL